MDEKINKKLLDDLKNLPKVSAPDNFDEMLWEKIYSGEEKKESFWQKIFTTNKLIPAATFAAVIIIFFLIRSNNNDYEDPFMIEPPVREDIITISNDDIDVSSMIEQKQKTEQQELRTNESEKSGLKKESAKPEKDSSLKDNLTEPSSAPQTLSKTADAVNDDVQFEIDKEELNFLKRNLSEQEKQEILELKRKIKASEAQRTE